MKIDKIKHNHSLTKLLKVFIFAIVMLIPAFSVLTRCLYVINNKNAYQSYENTLVNKEYTVINDSLLQNNYFYSFNIKTFIENTNATNTGQSPDLYPLEQLDWTKIGVSSSISEQTKSFHILRANASYTNIFLYDNERNLLINYSKSNTNWLNSNQADLIYYFTLSNYDTQSATIYGDYLLQYSFAPSTLSNVFEYSMEQLGQSEYLGWTQNTAIYTGINTMNTQLGITMPTYSMVLTYWFFMIIIYVIIDIILGIFTTLTHMLGKKME